MIFTKYYRRKGMPDAAPILAVQVNQESITEAAMLTHGHVTVEIHPETDERTVGINVATIEGVKRASTGDFVIRDKGGALHVRKEGHFLHHYEEVRTESEKDPRHTNLADKRHKQMEARDG